MRNLSDLNTKIPQIFVLRSDRFLFSRSRPAKSGRLLAGEGPVAHFFGDTAADTLAEEVEEGYD